MNFILSSQNACYFPIIIRIYIKNINNNIIKKNNINRDEIDIKAGIIFVVNENVSFINK
jgi:hypothetical protein